MRYRMATVRGAMLTGAFLAAMAGCSRFQKHREPMGVLVEKPVEPPAPRVLDFSVKSVESKPAEKPSKGPAFAPLPLPPRSPDKLPSTSPTSTALPSTATTKRPTPPLMPVLPAPRVVIEKTTEFLPAVKPTPPQVERLPLKPATVTATSSDSVPVPPLGKNVPVLSPPASASILPPEPPSTQVLPAFPPPAKSPAPSPTPSSAKSLVPAPAVKPILPTLTVVKPKPEPRIEAPASVPAKAKEARPPEAPSSAPAVIPTAQTFPEPQASKFDLPGMPAAAQLPDPVPLNSMVLPVSGPPTLEPASAPALPALMLPLPDPVPVNPRVVPPRPLVAPQPTLDVLPSLPTPPALTPAEPPSRVYELPSIPVPPLDPNLPSIAARPELPEVPPAPKPQPAPSPLVLPKAVKPVVPPPPLDPPFPGGNKFDTADTAPPLPKSMPSTQRATPPAPSKPTAPIVAAPPVPKPMALPKPLTPLAIAPSPSPKSATPVASAPPAPLPSPEAMVPLEGNMPTGPLTLTDAVSLAHRLQPRLRVFLESVIQAEGDEKVAHAPFLPTAAVGVSAGGFDLNVGGKGAPAGAPGSNFNFLPNAGALPTGLNMSSGYELAELKVQWLVTDFGRRLGRYRQAQLGVDIASLQTDRAFQTVAHEVVSAYYHLLRTRALRTTVADAAKRAEADLVVLRRLEKAGEVDRAKVLASEVRLSQVRRTLDSLEAADGTALSAFNLAIGLNVNCPTQVISDTVVPSFDLALADCLQEAVCHRRELEVAQRSVQMAQEGRNVAKADFRPRVIADGSLYDFQQGGPRGHADVAIGAIKLEWGLFEGGRRVGELRIADSKVRAAAAQAEVMADTIAFQVSDAYRQLIAAKRGIERSRPALDKARETYKLTFDKLKQGIASPSDASDAENALAQAEQDLLNSSFDFMIGLSRLNYVMGLPAIPGR